MNTHEPYAPGETPLEPTVPVGGNGGVAPRCQRIKKDGHQCGNAARSGFSVCPRHGAGFPSREAAGEKKRTGRPRTHGLYSRSGLSSLHDLMAEVAALEQDRDNTDREIDTLRATLWYLLEQDGANRERLERLDHILAVRAGELEGEREPGDLREAARCASEARSWFNRVAETSVRVIHAAGTRAETRVKLAEPRALEQFVKWMATTRDLCLDILEPAPLSLLEDRLQREVLGPLGARLPRRSREGLSTSHLDDEGRDS